MDKREKDNKQRRDDCNGSFPFELLILSLTLDSDIVAFPPCERLAFQGIVSMHRRILVAVEETFGASTCQRHQPSVFASEDQFVASGHQHRH